MTEDTPESAKREKAIFWRAYCGTCQKGLGQWSNEKKVAQNSADHHVRNNPNHEVEIQEK